MSENLSANILFKLPFLKETPDYKLPESLSVEQASSQATATYKASVIEAFYKKEGIDSHTATFADITGGMGIDTTFLSKIHNKGSYIERNPMLCQAAIHNFPLVGVDNVTVINADSTEFVQQMSGVTTLFADPARRSASGRKLVSISECEPDMVKLLQTLKQRCRLIAIKLSPMLDISMAIKELHNVATLHVISVKNECKEIFVCIDCNKSVEEPEIHCVDITSGTDFTFTASAERQAISQFSMPERYLYEPNASILKAGAFKCLGERLKLKKLHVSSHLYTSDKLINSFPGRVFSIADVRKVHKEHFKDIENANLTVRNFPTPVATIRKNIGIKEGGELYLFATTLIDNSKRIIVTNKIKNI